MDERGHAQEDARKHCAATAPGAANPRHETATPPGEARSCGKAPGNPRISE